MKITPNQLESVVAASLSVAEVLRTFGLKGGGSHNHMKKRIQKAGFSTSHFDAHNTGQRHVGGPRKRTWQEILGHHVRPQKEHAVRLRRALIEYGRAYICEGCGTPPEWNGQELRLQVDHKNKDTLDNRSDNLRFLCPNCHSQTENWGQSKGLTDVTSEARAARSRWKRRKEKRVASVGSEQPAL